MTLPQRTIEEVLVRLQREAKLREVYVEGHFDRDFFRWIAERLALHDVRIYPISTVEVPETILQRFGLTSGQRQKVQALAKCLEAHPSLHDRVLLIVDADLDYIFDRATYTPPLCGTSGTSMDLLLWHPETLNSFLSRVLGVDDPNSVLPDLMTATQEIAAQLFLFRAAKEDIGANWSLIDAADAVKKDGTFSFEEYCGKVADKNSARRSMHEDFPDALAKVRSRAETLPLLRKMHGHDVIAVAVKKLKQKGYGELCLRNHLETARVLMLAASWPFVAADDTVTAMRRLFMQLPGDDLRSEAIGQKL